MIRMKPPKSPNGSKSSSSFDIMQLDGMQLEVVDLTTAQTQPLRLSVLRADVPTKVVTFDGDDLPTTFHLGLRVGGEIVAVSSWMQVRYPDRPNQPAYQLRGMASATRRQRSGLGGALLTAGLRRCSEFEATLVWARARDTAVNFYERNGFEVVGPGYIDLNTGLPHHDIIRILTNRATTPAS